MSENLNIVQEKKYLTVAQLNHLLNTCLEMNFPEINFQAEISQISQPASGHIYLSLKDKEAQCAGVIWKSVALRTNLKLEIGTLVNCRARPNVWKQNGKLQLIISKIELAGEGALQRKFLEIKDKLEKEGLFDQDRKRALPFFPKAVGIVTSSTGAVIHDMQVKIKARMPQMQIYLVDVRVQGDGAAQEISEAIKLLNQSNLVDVIIVGRGGGSLEDLWAFNEEIVVRSIFASKIPVVSAVGHESDYSLSDYVADKRAPTPTAAAEMVVPNLKDLLLRISDLESRIHKYQRYLEPLTQSVDELCFRLQRRVGSLFENYHLKIDRLSSKLSPSQFSSFLKLLFSRLRQKELELEKFSPINKLQRDRDSLNNISKHLEISLQKLITKNSHLIERFEDRLRALNPDRVLERGYSLVQLNGKLIKSVSDLKIDQEVALKFYDGVAQAKIKELNQAKEKDGKSKN